MKRVLIFFTISLFLSPFLVCADDVSELKARISQLEKRIEHFDSTEQLRVEESTYAKDNLKTTLEIIEKKYDQKSQELVLKIKEREFYWRIGGVILVFLIPICIFGIIKHVRTFTRKKIAELSESNIESFKKMVLDYELETRLRKISKILVLSGSEENSLNMNSLMNQLGFKNYVTATVDTFWDNDTKKVKNWGDELDFGLVVFNHIPEGIINRLIAEGRKEVYLSYFTKGQQQITQREKISFANSKFTFYARVMEILKYQYLIAQ